MIINTSTNAYSQMQNTSGVADKKVSFQPVQANSIQNNTSSASGQVTLSGRGLMMSRLFGDSNANPPVQTQLTLDTIAMKGVNFLTESDRNCMRKRSRMGWISAMWTMWHGIWEITVCSAA